MLLLQLNQLFLDDVSRTIPSITFCPKRQSVWTGLEEVIAKVIADTLFNAPFMKHLVSICAALNVSGLRLLRRPDSGNVPARKPPEETK